MHEGILEVLDGSGLHLEQQSKARFDARVGAPYIVFNAKCFYAEAKFIWPSSKECINTHGGPGRVCKEFYGKALDCSVSMVEEVFVDVSSMA